MRVGCECKAIAISISKRIVEEREAQACVEELEEQNCSLRAHCVPDPEDVDFYMNLDKRGEARVKELERDARERE